MFMRYSYNYKKLHKKVILEHQATNERRYQPHFKNRL